MGHTFWDMWQRMGPIATAVVVVLFAMSVVAVAIAIDRARALLGQKARGTEYAAELERRLEKGKIEEAAGVDPERTSSLSRVLGGGLGAFVRLRDHAPARHELLEAVDEALDTAIVGETARMRRGLGTLATIGSTAPFVGLFGTVVGIIDSFGQLTSGEGSHLDRVSGGIAEALVATALGILVAVPAVMLFNFFADRVEGLESSLREAAGRLMQHVRQASWADASAAPQEEKA
jgi:biopolymer transport protein ExbB/biopolymer transport protein TolQ